MLINNKGIRCDKCLKCDFEGNRYKCLKCQDIDLCNDCYLNSTNQTKQVSSISDSTVSNLQTNSGSETSTSFEKDHQSTHPMQLILTQVNFEACQENENVYFMDRPSFTCPYCADSNLNVLSLCEHLASNHSVERRSSSRSSFSSAKATPSQKNLFTHKVACPICVSISTSGIKNSNHFMENLLQHINEIHLNDRSENNNQSLNVSTTASKNNSSISMSTKTLLECMVCAKVMNVPLVFPCDSQCFMCMEHVDTFKKNGDSITCGVCFDTINKKDIRVNKRFKASIDNEEYLTDIEKNLKIESKTILINLQLSTEALFPRESTIRNAKTVHFEELKNQIDEHTKKIKDRVDLFGKILKIKADKMEEEYSNKIQVASKQVKILRKNYEKKNDFLEELFRTPNLSIETVNSNKQELNSILQESELLKQNLDKICKDIQSVGFEANLISLESFGNLNSSLKSNLNRFKYENVQENLLPDNTLLEPTRVTSTTNNELSLTNSISSPCVEFNMNEYNSCEENSENNHSSDEIQSSYDLIGSYKKNSETSTDAFLSFSRTNSKKFLGGFIIIDVNTFKTIKKSSFGCKAWCAHVFGGDKIFIGTTGGNIKLLSLNDTKTCYRSFQGNSKQRINCLKVFPGKSENQPLLGSGHQDSIIKIWDINSAKTVFTLSGHLSWINCIEYLPNGNLISGSNDGTMKIWNLEDGSLIRTISRKHSKASNKSLSVYCMKVLDNKRIICGSGDGFIEIYNFETGECLSKTLAHLKYIWQLGLTSTGELISSSGDKTIKSWLIQKDELKYVRDFGENRYEILAFLTRADGVLISGSWDGFKKFDLNEGNLIETMNSSYTSDQIQFVDCL